MLKRTHTCDRKEKMKKVTIAIALIALITGGCRREISQTNKSGTCYKDWQIRNGKLYVDGKWVFLKIGKPLRNFANAESANQLISDLDIIQRKGYNCLELTCYWHHFDTNGDGIPDKSLEPLRNLLDAIYERGMFPCLGVETYSVGGGQIPGGFWEKHPDALAVNAEGRTIRDTEYGFNTPVPSIFSPEYRQAVHTFIKSMASGIDTRKLLYFETSVEPQYMGKENLCYSKHARKAYEIWLKDNGVNGPAWPESFPIPVTFRKNKIWNRFRAEFLAKWVNNDAAAFRKIAGEDAYIAVDYLETGGSDMLNRNGDSLIFLRHLIDINIIQVNWHWHLAKRSPNQFAYDNVWAVARESGCDWAVTEHMTFNGSDYSPKEAPAMLRNTIAQSTRFGWEFVDIAPSSDNSFCLYNKDWSAKPLIAVVESNWEQWLEEIRQAEEKNKTPGCRGR
jgi:hypothetical protein